MEAVDLFRRVRADGRRPALLESLGVRTSFGRRSILGCDPVRSAEVRDGRLHVDGADCGSALELLDLLEEGHGAGFFPAWIGFLSYEFARHVGLPVNEAMAGLPEAAFFLYPHGWLWEDGELVEEPLGDVIRTDDIEVDAGHRGDDGEPAALPPIALESDYPPDDFIGGVDQVQERIRAGWVYQVNLSHRFRFAARGVDPLVCYERLRATNPSPFFGIVEGDGWAVVSGSPERLFDVRDGVVTARPIAGTRPRSAAPARDDALEEEMRADRKEQAEHVMLVDLLRNDLSRVCEHGTVEVSEALTVERYSHVMHLVSEVRGRRRDDARLRDVVASIFPGGTITGAPKESVMTEIARLEPVSRGAYTGSLGYVSGCAVDFNILIRSFTFAGLQREDGVVRAGSGYLSGGGGIVIESDPENEYLETRHKVEALLHILGHGTQGVPPAAPRVVDSWRPPRPPRRFDGLRVVFLENHDSFSFNIVNYLEMLGAAVRVVDHLVAPDLGDATHVVVGPGPGEPATAGQTLAWVDAALAAGLPFLGVCLGHQALGVGRGGGGGGGGRGCAAPRAPSTANRTRYVTTAVASSPVCPIRRSSRGTTRWCWRICPMS